MTATLTLDARPRVRGPEPPPPPVGVPPIVQRVRIATICVALTVLAFVQEPGRLSRDTKLDLYLDPAGFLSRALHLWDPDTAFGGLQNQAYGYLFPMGPFYLLADAAGLPVWVAQRLWMAGLLCVGFLGMLRLCTALGVGGPVSRTVAALAFALSPRVATTIGPISSETLPLMVAPWALVPLVGDLARRAPRRAAGLSALAVLAAGGVNAVATLAVCVPPALWLLTRSAGPARRRLVRWWVLATSAACLWWAIPLVVFGRYSFSFLDYIETAAATTRDTSLAEVLRGTSHWVAAFTTGGVPWWRGGWVVESNGVVVLYSLVLAAFGLLGLVLPALRERLFLVGCLVVGCLLVGFGHGGPGGPFLAATERELLDGVLAPLRNVHKFDLVVRIPLVIGLCHLLAGTRQPSADRVLRLVAPFAVAVVAAPFLLLQIVPAGAYPAVPGYWAQTADWLADRGATQRTLLLPAAGFGEYLWGRPMDEPMHALMSTPWAARDQIPLGSEGSIRLLDAVEGRIASGEGSPGLAAYLNRAGVGYVVVRNDLDWARLGATRPALVHQALTRSGGFRRVATFGPLVAAAPSGGRLVSDYGQDVHYPAVEIFAVGAAASLVTTYPADDVVAVAGGPEALLDAADRGLLTDRATVLADDPQAPGARPARTLLTDGMRRREVNFGLVVGNTTQTFTPSEQPTQQRVAHDYLPYPGIRQTSAGWTGVRDVTASSSASQTDALSVRGSQFHPGAAVDGNADSAWVSGSRGPAVGQWWQTTLVVPTRVPRMTVSMLDTVLLGTRVTALRVSTSSGSRLVSVPTAARPVTVDLDDAPTRFVRITVARLAAGNQPSGPVGIREVGLAGVRPERYLRLPTPSPHSPSPTAVLMNRAVGSRSACVTTSGPVACAPSLTRLGEEEGPFARRFTTLRDGTPVTSVAVLPRPGPALEALLAGRLLPAGVTVRVSSTLTPDTRSGAVALYDGDPATTWTAGSFDPTPTVEVRWQGVRRVDRVVLDRSRLASRPTSVVVTTPDGRRTATVDADGTARFAPLSTTSLRLTFPSPTLVHTIDPAGGRYDIVPVGLAGLSVPGTLPAAPQTPPAVEYCGSGPTLQVDGGRVDTRLTWDVPAILAGRRLTAVPCGEVVLAAGEHRLTAADTGVWRVMGVTMVPGGWTAPPSRTERPVEVERWDDTRRVLWLGAGGQTVLVVAENLNPGWRATLNGEPLLAARIDGWRQGWVVPEGAAGRVVLDYGPQRAYLAGLVVGALAVTLLVALVLVPVWRRRVTVAAGVVPRRGAGAWSGARGGTAGVRPRWWQVAVLLALVVGVGGAWAAAVVGVLLAVVLGTALAGRRSRWSLSRPALLTALLVVAGLGLIGSAAGAVTGWLPGEPQLRAAAQLCGLAALTVVVLALAADPRRPGPAPRRPSATTGAPTPGRPGTTTSAPDGASAASAASAATAVSPSSGTAAPVGVFPPPGATSAGAAPAARPGTSSPSRTPPWPPPAPRG